MGKNMDMFFSFDKETKEVVAVLGYIPKGCYCSEGNMFIPEHAEKNREIVKKELSKVLREMVGKD